MTWLQWVQIVEVPLLLALAAHVVKVRDDLAAFKLKVAETYATVAYLKDVESRVVTRLDKLDGKIDRVLERVTGHD